MPTIPATPVFNASAIDVLNAIRANASVSYQERIPEATKDNIKEIGNAMLSYQPTQNEFLSALVNRIARVIITSKSYTNPLKMFKKGTLEYGETVEEVFVQIAKAHQFDPVVAEKEVFKREIPDVAAIFHKLNVQNFYKTTISNEQLRQAFLSVEGVNDLIAKIVDSLYTGSEVDEYVYMKQLIVDAANKGQMKLVRIPEWDVDDPEIPLKKIVKQFKSFSNKLEFMSNAYNAYGVTTHTPKSEQVLIIDAALDAAMDVDVLASAFNMDKAQFMGQRVLIDNFGSLTGACAALVDKDWFMVFDNLTNFTENYNGEGMYWNYFYHVWRTYSTSLFANAILFTTDATTTYTAPQAYTATWAAYPATITAGSIATVAKIAIQGVGAKPPVVRVTKNNVEVEADVALTPAMHNNVLYWIADVAPTMTGAKANDKFAIKVYYNIGGEIDSQTTYVYNLTVN